MQKASLPNPHNICTYDHDILILTLVEKCMDDWIENCEAQVQIKSRSTPDVSEVLSKLNLYLKIRSARPELTLYLQHIYPPPPPSNFCKCY